MKDYRLSEIKEICDRQQNCNECPFGTHCIENCFSLLNEEGIEPRDMIELPYKEFHEVYAGHGLWFVFYRTEGGLIDSRYFNEEPEADAFLIELRGSKK